MPATSPPGIYGRSALNWYLSSNMRVSGNVTGAALTSISTSPGPGVGSATSSITKSSGGPNCLHKTARMATTIGDYLAACAGASIPKQRVVREGRLESRVGRKRRSIDLCFEPDLEFFVTSYFPMIPGGTTYRRQESSEFDELHSHVYVDSTD